MSPDLDEAQLRRLFADFHHGDAPVPDVDALIRAGRQRSRWSTTDRVLAAVAAVVLVAAGGLFLNAAREDAIVAPAAASPLKLVAVDERFSVGIPVDMLLRPTTYCFMGWNDKTPQPDDIEQSGTCDDVFLSGVDPSWVPVQHHTEPTVPQGTEFGFGVVASPAVASMVYEVDGRTVPVTLVRLRTNPTYTAYFTGDFPTMAPDGRIVVVAFDAAGREIARLTRQGSSTGNASVKVG